MDASAEDDPDFPAMSVVGGKEFDDVRWHLLFVVVLGQLAAIDVGVEREDLLAIVLWR